MNKDFIFNKWDRLLYEDFLEHLISLGDDKLIEFNSKIINTKQEIIGIKTPILRNIAKNIAKGNIESFLEIVNDHYFEESLIEGFVIGYITDKDVFLKYFNSFIKKPYNPIFKRLQINSKSILMIVPIKLSNIIFLALLIACNMLANGDWIYSIKKNGAINFKYELP